MTAFSEVPWRRVLAVVALLAVPSALAAQGTALVLGTVEDAGGQPLEGVSVELSSAAEVRGTLTTTTSASGYYRMAGLAPGEWELRFKQPGFAELIRSGLVLSVGAELTLDVEMQVGATDSVTVLAAAPVVETTKSSVGEVVSKEFIEQMPVQDGKVFDLLPTVAGLHRQVNTEQLTGLGESARGLNVIIDGIDNNNNQDQFGQILLDQYFHETIQEIEVLTSGYNAEYGDASGAVARIVTKSGRDELHGRVFYSHRSDALASSPIEGQEPAPIQRNEYGVTLGGPLLRERLWFFGAVRIVDGEEGTEFDVSQVPEALRTNFFGEPEDFEETRSQVDEKIFFLKTTAALGRRHRLNLSIMHFPNRKTNRAGFAGDTGPIGGRVLPSAGLTLERPGQQYKANLLLAPGSSVLLETNLGFLRFDEKALPNDARPPHEEFPDFAAGNADQTPTEVQYRKFQWSSDFTLHLEGRGGSHRLKAGVRLIRDAFRTAIFEWGDIVIYATNDRSTPVITQQPRSLDPQGGVGFDVSHVSKAFYLQDSWRPSPRLTINLGYRFDVTAPFDHPNHSPRAGVAWDPVGDGTTVVRAHYGRFYDGGLGNLLLLIPEFGGIPFDFVIWSGLATHLGGDGQPISAEASQVIVVDRPFRTPFTDAFVLGVEREIAPGWSASAEFVDRNSEGVLGGRLVNWDSQRGATVDGGPVQWSIGNWNTSRFRSFQVTLRKRFSGRFQLLTSYSYSDWNNLGQNSMFSVPDDEADPEADFGPAEASIPHAFKLSGFYALPAGFSLSAIFAAQSGLPFSAASTADLDGDGFTERPPEAPFRNAFRRDRFVSLDVRLAKALRVGKGQLEVRVDAFNLTNHRNVRDVFDLFGSDDFGGPQTFFQGRTIQLGARYTF